MKTNKHLLLIISAFLLAGTATLSATELKLASLFTDHSVLQRDATVPVWGWAEPNDEVTVEFAGQKQMAKADAGGKWMVKFNPMPMSAEPRDLVVHSKLGNQRLKISDVLVGDVWLCSGQSNMVIPVRAALNGDAEAAKADHPQIRLFQVARVARETPQPVCDGNWRACSPVTVKGFCAVGYYFGRELHAALHVPIGLIQSSWGSTAAEAWTSEAALASSPEFKPLIGTRVEPKRDKSQNAGGDGDKGVPSGIYNGMIAPLVPYALRGTIWYQGENNASGVARAEAYRRLLPLMVNGWHKDFAQEFPFYIVQLANYAKRGDSSASEPWPVSLWSVLRESQAQAAASLPKSGLAVTIDIGDPENIHPKNKQEVGRRLALVALANEYGQKLECSGPAFSTMKDEGSTAVLTFTHSEGLAAKGGALKGFVIAGEDGHFQPANAVIDGTTVRVSSPAVAKPVAVRYAWAGSPECNLVNAAGLPAGPFRSPMK